MEDVSEEALLRWKRTESKPKPVSDPVEGTGEEQKPMLAPTDQQHTMPAKSWTSRSMPQLQNIQIDPKTTTVSTNNELQQALSRLPKPQTLEERQIVQRVAEAIGLKISDKKKGTVSVTHSAKQRTNSAFLTELRSRIAPLIQVSAEVVVDSPDSADQASSSVVIADGSEIAGESAAQGTNANESDTANTNTTLEVDNVGSNSDSGSSTDDVCISEQDLSPSADADVDIDIAQEDKSDESNEGEGVGADEGVEEKDIDKSKVKPGVLGAMQIMERERDDATTSDSMTDPAKTATTSATTSLTTSSSGRDLGLGIDSSKGKPKPPFQVSNRVWSTPAPPYVHAREKDSETTDGVTATTSTMASGVANESKQIDIDVDVQGVKGYRVSGVQQGGGEGKVVRPRPIDMTKETTAPTVTTASPSASVAYNGDDNAPQPGFQAHGQPVQQVQAAPPTYTQPHSVFTQTEPPPHPPHFQSHQDHQDHIPTFDYGLDLGLGLQQQQQPQLHDRRSVHSIHTQTPPQAQAHTHPYTYHHTASPHRNMNAPHIDKSTSTAAQADIDFDIRGNGNDLRYSGYSHGQGQGYGQGHGNRVRGWEVDDVHDYDSVPLPSAPPAIDTHHSHAHATYLTPPSHIRTTTHAHAHASPIDAAIDHLAAATDQLSLSMGLGYQYQYQTNGNYTRSPLRDNQQQHVRESYAHAHGPIRVTHPHMHDEFGPYRPQHQHQPHTQHHQHYASPSRDQNVVYVPEREFTTTTTTATPHHHHTHPYPNPYTPTYPTDGSSRPSAPRSAMRQSESDSARHTPTPTPMRRPRIHRPCNPPPPPSDELELTGHLLSLGDDWGWGHLISEFIDTKSVSTPAITTITTPLWSSRSPRSPEECVEWLRELRQLMDRVKLVVKHRKGEDRLLKSIEGDGDGETSSLMGRAMERLVEYACITPLKSSVDAMLNTIAGKRDTALIASLTHLRGNTQEYFGISNEHVSASSWCSAVSELNCIDSATLPCDKLRVLASTMKSIFHEVAGLDSKPLGAYDLVPILAYSIANADIEKPELTADYILNLCDPTVLVGNDGYHLMCYQSALNVLSTMGHLPSTNK